ncbi:MAG: polysaccharide biosynthesis/export family protein [Candidatus Wallbacteria bacterium]|nr:polysaccharide biosynthesis/export family protein [Candidatus Wallbacteria bacterium]
MAGKILAALLLLYTVTLLGSVVPSEEKYRVGVEDQLRIFVDRHSELTVSVPVGPDGYISYPLIGNVQVLGLSREEVRLKMTQLLSKYYKNPMVSVVIEAYNSFKVAVLGEVGKPGLYVLKSEPTVMHAISMAEGPKDTASLSEAYLKKADSSELLRLDLYSLLVKGDMTKNLELGPGDVIYVPQGTKNQFYILGEVIKPGVFPMKDGLTLLEAIALAGSETDKAMMRRISIVRKKEGKTDPDIYIVNAEKIIREGKLEFNMKIEPGDVIYVPKSAKPEWDRIAPMLTTISTTHGLVKGW